MFNFRFNSSQNDALFEEIRLYGMTSLRADNKRYTFSSNWKYVSSDNVRMIIVKRRQET